MPVVRCPRCGAVFQSEDAALRTLSGRALHVLTNLPESMQRGKTILVRDLAQSTGYSIGQVHLALQELSQAGYINKQSIGAGKKHTYRAVPHLHQQLSLVLG